MATVRQKNAALRALRTRERRDDAIVARHLAALQRAMRAFMDEFDDITPRNFATIRAGFVQLIRQHYAAMGDDLLAATLETWEEGEDEVDSMLPADVVSQLVRTPLTEQEEPFALPPPGGLTPVPPGGQQPGLIGIPDAMLRGVAQRHYAGLIQAETEFTIQQVSGATARFAVGQDTLLDLRRYVGRTLTTSLTFKSMAHRVEAVTRTETNRIFSMSSQRRMEAAQFHMPDLRKEWVSVADDRTRPAHAAANGQVVGVDEPFLVAGQELMHPRDMTASAANSVNCRCVHVPVPPETRRRERGGGIEDEFAGEEFPEEFLSGDEASDWLTDRWKTAGQGGKGIVFDFKNMRPDIVTRMARQAHSNLLRYPQLREHMTRIEVVNAKQSVNLPWGGKAKQIKQGVYARAFRGHGHIQLNSQYFGKRHSRDIFLHLESDVQYGFHPAGTATPEAVMSHEMGHVVQSFYTNANKAIPVQTGTKGLQIELAQSKNGTKVKDFFDTDVLEAFRKVDQNDWLLSGYAKESEWEAFAEGFSVIVHNPELASALPYTRWQSNLLNTLGQSADDWVFVKGDFIPLPPDLAKDFAAHYATTGSLPRKGWRPPPGTPSAIRKALTPRQQAGEIE